MYFVFHRDPGWGGVRCQHIPKPWRSRAETHPNLVLGLVSWQAVINGVSVVWRLLVWGRLTSTSEAPSPVVSLCDLAVMYVIGFWLNKSLKLHTYCVSAKPAFTATGACSARLSWLPTSGIPPLVPCRLLKEKDNRIRSGFLGSIDCHIQLAGVK